MRGSTLPPDPSFSRHLQDLIFSTPFFCRAGLCLGKHSNIDSTGSGFLARPHTQAWLISISDIPFSSSVLPRTSVCSVCVNSVKACTSSRFTRHSHWCRHREPRGEWGCPLFMSPSLLWQWTCSSFHNVTFTNYGIFRPVMTLRHGRDTLWLCKFLSEPLTLLLLFGVVWSCEAVLPSCCLIREKG